MLDLDIVEPTQSQRLLYTSSSTFRNPIKPSPATSEDFMYDSGEQNNSLYYCPILQYISCIHEQPKNGEGEDEEVFLI